MPSVLRQLRALHGDRAPRERGRPQPPDLRRVRDMAWRILRGAFGPDDRVVKASRISEAQIELTTLLERLTLRIEQFLHMTSLAGSPAEYQQDLRQAQMMLGRLVNDDGASGMTLDTFKTLSHIVDLVELTRRDVERRSLDDPVAAMRFATARLPTDAPQDAAEIIHGEIGATGEADPRRVVLVAQLIYDLQYSYTPRGIVQWFRRPAHELADRSPLETLGDPELAATLRSFARSLRSQLAT